MVLGVQNYFQINLAFLDVGLVITVSIENIFLFVFLSRVVCVGLIQVLRLRQIGPCIGRTSCFRSNWVFRGVTPVGQSNLKTYRTDYQERCRKTIPLRVDPVERLTPLPKGVLEILSKVLVAQEKSLSFTYGRPYESCGSFTPMYFGKRRASRINLFWSR